MQLIGEGTGIIIIYMLVHSTSIMIASRVNQSRKKTKAKKDRHTTLGRHLLQLGVLGWLLLRGGGGGGFWCHQLRHTEFMIFS